MAHPGFAFRLGFYVCSALLLAGAGRALAAAEPVWAARDVPNALPTRSGAGGTQVFEFSFQDGPEGWQGGFVDYPAGQEDFMELHSDWRALPIYLAPGRMALFISGNNHSDDLFMLFKRCLAGLQADTLYQVAFTVEFATNAPSDCGGIGGPPGTGVTLKVGAAAVEPVGVIPDASGWFRLNLDKGNQVAGGADAVSIGHIGNTRHCPDATYEFKTLSTPGTAFYATTGNDGILWALFGTDSGFEGTTSLYYSFIRIELAEAGRAGDLDGNGAAGAVDLVILAQFLAGNLTPGPPPFTAPLKAADVNGQWGVTAEDLLALAMMLAGQ